MVKNTFSLLLNRPFYMKLLFVVTFIIYGIVISVISFSISNHYQTLQTKEKIIETQRQSFKTKSIHLKGLMTDFRSKMTSIKESHIFKNYINNINNNSNIRDLFSVVINQSPQLSQLRYIDENGFERIRFDRKKINENSFEVPFNKLQNKSSRYYTKEIGELKDGEIWYSKLDLNIENGKIERPIVPTLRMGVPIYDNKVYKGFIIMNIFFKDIINDFVSSAFFYITIYDKDGEFIHHKHPDENGVMVDYSWSRYLNKNFNLDIHKNNLKNLLSDPYTKDYVFNMNITDMIPNADKLSIYYEPKIIKLKEIEKNERSYILTVMFIVLLISIPLALIMSIIPAKLNDELYNTKKLLEEISITDELTQLFNRREFNHIFKMSLAHSKRENTPFAMMILDIDYFKQYNDTYGHFMGDDVLRTVSKTMKHAAQRETDYVFRLGGEEFGIIFSSKSLDDAKAFAHIVKDAIHDQKLEHSKSQISSYITVSVGLLFSNSIDTLNEHEVYSMCDEALYQSKADGRNKVTIVEV